MHIAAVTTKTTNMAKSIEFYQILGLKFAANQENEDHVENIHADTEIKLMIDTNAMFESITGKKPESASFSAFAILYDSAAEVNKFAGELKAKGFEIVKEPWNAFWGQRYCIVQDPGGSLVDLYAYLK
ncbi:MAG: VOC family protein [bacterium]